MEDNLHAIERRRKNNEFLARKGITYLENLPILEDEMKNDFRNIDDICKRAIACLISIQLACDINNGANYEESRDFCSKMITMYGVQDAVIPKEKRLYNGTYTKQDVLDITWSYECYWSLVWALGLVDTNEFAPNSICNCQKAIDLVVSCKTYQEFKNRCNLRDLDEILDMLDLHYRFHWACVEKRVNPDSTNISDLNPEVVYERRRGLEWLFSNEDDWYNISLDT